MGDEVLGWSDSRSAQAGFVLTDPGHLVPKPLVLDWVRAGSLWAAGVTPFAAVRAVSLLPATWWPSAPPPAEPARSPSSPASGDVASGGKDT